MVFLKPKIYVKTPYLQVSLTQCNVNNDVQIPEPDRTKWNLNLDSINFLIINPPKIYVTTIQFEKTKIIINNVTRCLTTDNFSRKLQNGEKKLRNWLLYFSTKNALFLV